MLKYCDFCGKPILLKRTSIKFNDRDFHTCCLPFRILQREGWNITDQYGRWSCRFPEDPKMCDKYLDAELRPDERIEQFS